MSEMSTGRDGVRSSARSIVLRGDARALPLSDGSVDLIVTSPPYFGLRSYTDGGEHYAGQIGDEATPDEFLHALRASTREWMRVLTRQGSLWVNLGDKYVADNRGSSFDPKRGAAKYAPAGEAGFVGRGFAPQKSLMGLPWRYALSCVDDLGLTLRAEVIWAKPNGMPESATDRVRRSHEQWFHFTKGPRYYAAVDRIREPHAPWTLKAYAYEQANDYARRANPNRVDEGQAKDYAVANPLGKLPGSVREVTLEPLRVPASLGVDHFAAFPTEWPRWIIQGWSPDRVCLTCYQGLRPVSVREMGPDNQGRVGVPHGGDRLRGHTTARRMLDGVSLRTITHETCACEQGPGETRPGVVLDPFGGTGTTALCAEVLGRVGISVDLSADYCRLATWRTNDPAQRAKAMRVDKPPAVAAGQLDLLAGAS